MTVLFKVKDLMTKPVLTIDPEKSVFQAAEYMQVNELGGLPVVENGKLVGIITSRDIRLNHPNRIVADAMTKNIICSAPSDTILDAAETMQKHKIERLPVVENEKLLGIVTKSQIMKHLGQIYDPLTGMYNLIFLYQIANKLLSAGNDITIILFDLNDFGKINKEMGHINGDKCLIEISRILVENSDNKHKFACRYGGDEFVVVTLDKISDAAHYAEKIIDLIADNTRKAGVPVTVSAGISGNNNYANNDAGYYKVIEILINNASLASSKAKASNQKYVIAS